MTNSRKSDLEFIMQDPNERFSSETRTKIRKQAMRGRVGAPRYRSGPSSSPSPPRIAGHRRRCDSDLGHPMPLSGLELLIRDRGIDPLDLSALASIHIGTVLVIPDPVLSDGVC
jgi:hypothetical protein